ncbi:MAG: pentapeptide repeat-containing protein, partial [Caldilinea sp.]
MGFVLALIAVYVLFFRYWETMRAHLRIAGAVFLAIFTVFFALFQFNLLLPVLISLTSCVPDCTGANLVGRSLNNLNLETADFVDANLSGVDLSRSQLSDADFSGANLA